MKTKMHDKDREHKGKTADIKKVLSWGLCGYGNGGLV